MPLVHPTHVVSFSSEDQYHPASNLLNRETYRKWKCKDAGEKEAFVLLKFEKAETINAIDIGNDGSALVEVLVARSGNGGEPQFEVLLSSTAFMSPGDSRDGKNLNGVRTFSLNSLSKPVAAQKWDLVKILVSQPFNKHVQYGLTFIKFVSAPDPNEPKKIGGFGFRTAIGGADSDDEDARPGRLFSSFSKSPKKESGPPATGSPAAGTSAPPKIFGSSSSSTNSEIRDTVAKLAGAAKSKTDHEVKDILKKSKPDIPIPSPATNGSKVPAGRNNSPVPNRQQQPDPSLKTKKKDDTSAARNQGSGSSSSSPSVSKPAKKRQLSPAPQTTNSPTPSSSKGGPPKQKKSKKTKPFNKLFEGVVFSMSGFQNPLRGQLRDKAVEMGARYRGDWDRTCTHLICAFYNTPKFQEVRTAGNGKIVKKNWIEECYNNKCRYPWRRYCLDRGDRGSDSEDEIFTESNDNNDEEELLDEEPMQTDTNSDEEVKTKRKRVMVMDSSDESENDSKKAYDVDTDVDDDKTPDLSPSILTTSESYTAFFENKGFCLQPSVYEGNASEIPEMIKKHNGRIHKTLSDTVEYYVCNNKEWTDDYADAFSDNPNLTFIHEDWILQCHSEDCLVDVTKFLLRPQ